MEASTHNVVFASPTHSKPGCAIFVARFSGYDTLSWLECYYLADAAQLQDLLPSGVGVGEAAELAIMPAPLREKTPNKELLFDF